MNLWFTLVNDSVAMLNIMIPLHTPIIVYTASRSARYNVSVNYHKPRLPATTYLLPNANYMNNIFKPVID